MIYRYIKNHRDKKTLKAQDLSQIKSSKPKFSSKQKYKEWCADPATDHVFYATAEGSTPGVRISNDNPVTSVWGFAADYDAPLDWDIVDQIIQTNCKGHLPTWRSETESGYIRLVWEFKKRMPINPDMYPAFMKRLSTLLGAERIFAGFDTASLRAGQYFELGTNWVKVDEALDPAVYQSALMKAAEDAPPQTTTTAIPMDEVARAVAEKFPGRWEGEFTLGARGPLFWVDDGIEREGCQVSEEGMICYSDRAGKGFIPWREVFGSKFVSQWETKKYGSLLDEYWFNGKSFYKLIDDSPAVIPKDQLILELRKGGFAPRPKKGQALSEVETALLSICNDNRVAEIAPVIFSSDRVVHYNSHKILNSSNLRPIEPADSGDPKQWPFIHKWIHQLFVNGKRPTTDYLFAWLKIIYKAVLDREKAQGQALLLVGPTNKGKTLLSNRVISALLGGCSDASDYLSGQTSFNKELARTAAWVIDDTTSAASFQDQRRLTELVKRAVANPRLGVMAKYQDQITVPWTGRVIMSLNMDPNSLSVIPALDSSNRGKIMALLVSDKATSKFPPNVDLERTIADELPYFGRWLLSNKTPKEIVGTSRFGVVSHINGKIASAAYDNSSRSAVAELVEFFAKKARTWIEDPVWVGTLTEFQVALHEFNGGKSVGLSNNLEFVRRGMQIIEESCKNSKHVRPVKSVGLGAGKLWSIDLSDEYDIGNALKKEKIPV